ncbi:MAG: LPS-assembly protein LptD [Candidatus Comchoanobacterales bacterium]
MLTRIVNQLKYSYCILCCVPYAVFALDVFSWEPNDGRCGGQFLPVKQNYPLEGNDIELVASDQTTIKPGDHVIDMSGPVMLTKKDLYVISEQGVLIHYEQGKQWVTLKGPILMQYGNQQFGASKGVYHVDQQTIQLHDVQYRTNIQHLEDQPILWGSAKELTYDQNIVLTEATYSSCSLDQPTWQIALKELKFNQKTNELDVKGAQLKWLDHTLIQLPIISVDLTMQRRSGFLMPKWRYDDHHWAIDIPWYWNIAPNTDATLHGLWSDQYGFGGAVLWRYLQPWGEGSAELGGYAQSTELSTGSSHRSWLGHEIKAERNHWSFTSQYYWLEDPLIIRDFEVFSELSHDYNLPQNFQIGYHNDDDFIRVGIHDYQFLSIPNDMDHIQRYASWPKISSHVERQLSSQIFLASDLEASWFKHDTRDEYRRLYWHPQFIWSQNQDGQVWTLEMLGHLRDYQQTNGNDHQTDVLPELLASWQAPPIVIDKHIIHPSIVYHYTPYHNQDNLPLLDTTTFNVDGLLHPDINVYDGHDLISNYNDLTASLGFGHQDDDHYWWVDVALGYRFGDQQVCMKTRPGVKSHQCNNVNHEHWLPISWHHEWQPTLSWLIQDQLNYDASLHNIHQGLIRLQYSIDEHNKTGIFIAQKNDVVHEINGINVTELFDHATIGIDHHFDNNVLTWDVSAELLNSDKKAISYDVLLGYQGCCSSSGIKVSQRAVALSDEWDAWASPNIGLWIKLDGLGRWGF